MRFKPLVLFYALLIFAILCQQNSHLDAVDIPFIKTRIQLDDISNNPNAVIIASTGRSASTMLVKTIANFSTNQNIYKMHCLPPQNHFKGKILFIFSNPDLAAESAFHRMLENTGFGNDHFMNLETSDHAWLIQLGGIQNQTLTNNLLGYDALGCATHLSKWLHDRTIPSDVNHAQILAIKYENLWDKNTIQAIKQFLSLPELKFPSKRDRGYKKKVLTSMELAAREMYNVGSSKKPRYVAYDIARAIWDAAPPFQFLRIKE